MMLRHGGSQGEAPNALTAQGHRAMQAAFGTSFLQKLQANLSLPSPNWHIHPYQRVAPPNAIHMHPTHLLRGLTAITWMPTGKTSPKPRQAPQPSARALGRSQGCGNCLMNCLNQVFLSLMLHVAFYTTFLRHRGGG